MNTTNFVCDFCGRACKNHNSWRNHSRLCKLNPDRQLTTYEKYGATPGFNTVGKKAWNKGKTAAEDSSVLKISQTLKSKYQSGELVAYQPMNDPEVRKRHKASMKKAYANYTKRTPGKFKYGRYKGIWCDSSWELAYLLYCLDFNITIERNKRGFSYIWEESIHSYFPDFYLPDTNQYVEIKGYRSARDEAKINQFTESLKIIDAKEIRPILEHVQQKYGTQFIDLYEK